MFSCYHLVQYVACAEHIAVDLVLAFDLVVIFEKVDFRGRVDGGAALESRFSIADSPGSPKICNFEFVVRGKKQVVGLQVPMEVALVERWVPLSLMYFMPETSCLARSKTCTSVSRFLTK